MFPLYRTRAEGIQDAVGGDEKFPIKLTEEKFVAPPSGSRLLFDAFPTIILYLLCRSRC